MYEGAELAENVFITNVSVVSSAGTASAKSSVTSSPAGTVVEETVAYCGVPLSSPVWY